MTVVWPGRLQLRRGPLTNIPIARGLLGEPFVTLDTRELFVAVDTTTAPLPLRVAVANVIGLLNGAGVIPTQLLPPVWTGSASSVTTHVVVTAQAILDRYDETEGGLLLLSEADLSGGVVAHVYLDGRLLAENDGWYQTPAGVYGYCPPDGDPLRAHWVEHGVTWTVVWSA